MDDMKISDFLRGSEPSVGGRFEEPVTADPISPARKTFVAAAIVPTGVGMTCSIGRKSAPT
jgi:hypothetical protein